MAHFRCATPAAPTIVIKGDYRSPLLSGDHCWVLYDECCGHNVHAVRSDGSGDQIVVPGGIFPSRGLVSHDGNALAIETDQGGFWLHQFGGATTKLGDAHAWPRLGAFSSDDKSLLVATDDAVDGRAATRFSLELRSVAAAGAGAAQPLAITRPASWINPNSDGSYYVMEGDPSVPFEGGSLEEIGAGGSTSWSQYRALLDPAPTTDGMYALSLQGKGDAVLSYVPLRAGGSVYLGDLWQPQRPVPSPDGQRVAVVSTRFQPSIETLEVWSRAGEKLTVASPASGNIIWSDDSNRMLYTACAADAACFFVHDFRLARDFALPSALPGKTIIEGLTSDGAWALVGPPLRVVQVDGGKVLYAAADGSASPNAADAWVHRAIDGRHLYWQEVVGDRRVVMVFDEDGRVVLPDPMPSELSGPSKNAGLALVGDGVDSFLYVSTIGGKRVLRAHAPGTRGFVTLADDLTEMTIDVAPDRAAGVYISSEGGIKILALP